MYKSGAFPFVGLSVSYRNHVAKYHHLASILCPYRLQICF